MPEFDTLQVRVPASSANLGPGFDTLALALGLHLRCTLRKSQSGLRFQVSGIDADMIPHDESNLVWKAFTHLSGKQAGAAFELESVNEIPIGKGLGSSAAAIVAGLALANEWFALGKSKDQIIEIATEMEGHPDNVAAAVRGGLVVSCQAGDGAVIAVNFPLKTELEVALVVPQFQLSTEAARAALPPHYSRGDVVFNLQRLALLLSALREEQGDLLAEAMQDRIHQPYRAPLVPGFQDILELRNIPGLLGLALSGAGPSVVAFCSSQAAEVGEAIASCFRRHGIEAQGRRLPIDSQGLVVEKAL
ncbi:MAG: homoserine kinase [Acidobacteria bacterium]|nr:homoserine kinase [Acidobacteriota bacterium]